MDCDAMPLINEFQNIVSDFQPRAWRFSGLQTNFEKVILFENLIYCKDRIADPTHAKKLHSNLIQLSIRKPITRIIGSLNFNSATTYHTGHSILYNIYC